MIRFRIVLGSFCAVGLLAAGGLPSIAFAQDVAAVSGDAESADAAEASGMTDDELEVLVAPIALYPDDLVALIAAASLFPLQIVEAERFLETADPDAQPKDSWDGSVISLLNYPEVVKMMSDDLEWTQNLGTALAYQQKDVLVAIQQLRAESVDKGVIKTDDKMTVTSDAETETVVIQSASPDVVYVPQYEPEMLYEPDYEIVPIGYYPDPYPYYYSPAATYFAGFVTGAVWGAMVDWNDWGVWGGSNWGNDIEVNCNNCFNNINGKVRAGDIDWRNVDRSKVSVDRDQFNGANRDHIRTSLKSDQSNSVRTRATTVKREHETAAKHGKELADVRQSAHRPGADGKRPGGDGQLTTGSTKRPGAGGGGTKDRPAVAGGGKKPDVGGGDRKRQASTGGGKKPAVKHTATKPKPAARPDHRPRKPSGLGEVSSGKKAVAHSSKGRQAMGGGGKPHKSAGGGGGRRGGGGGRHR